MKVSNLKPFSIPTRSFGISASPSEYKILYSVDGNTYTEYATVPANDNLIINSFPPNIYFKLDGLTTDIYVQY